MLLPCYVLNKSVNTHRQIHRNAIIEIVFSHLKIILYYIWFWKKPKLEDNPKFCFLMKHSFLSFISCKQLTSVVLEFVWWRLTWLTPSAERMDDSRTYTDGACLSISFCKLVDKWSFPRCFVTNNIVIHILLFSVQWKVQKIFGNAPESTTTMCSYSLRRFFTSILQRASAMAFPFLTFLLPLTNTVGCSVVMETATWVLLLLCVLQVQTLYYSADHKLLDGSLLDSQAEVFGTEDDHIQFVQVHNQRWALLRLDRSRPGAIARFNASRAAALLYWAVESEHFELERSRRVRDECVIGF